MVGTSDFVLDHCVLLDVNTGWCWTRIAHGKERA